MEAMLPYALASLLFVAHSNRPATTSPVDLLLIPVDYAIIRSMLNRQWPDPLSRPEPARIQWLLEASWRQLNTLPDLLNRAEHLLAERCTASMRDLIIEMMLALNGIQWPTDTKHLNIYLSASQRAALEKTLMTP